MGSYGTTAIFWGALVPLEILNFAFMLFGRSAGLKSTEVATSLGLRIDLARIQPIFAAADFPDHGVPLRLRSYLRILHFIAGSKRRPVAAQDIAVSGVRFRPTLHAAGGLTSAYAARSGAAMPCEEILEPFVVIRRGVFHVANVRRTRVQGEGDACHGPWSELSCTRFGAPAFASPGYLAQAGMRETT